MVQLNLPALRSFLWGSKVNQALEDLNDAKTEAADVQAIAETVAQDKFNEVVAAPNDAVVEALVQDSGSATAAALNSTYGPGSVAGAPPWAGTARAGSWDAQAALYNGESSTLRDIRQMIADARSGTATTRMLFAGDSKTAGSGLLGGDLNKRGTLSMPAQITDLLGGKRDFVYCSPLDAAWTLADGAVVDALTSRNFVNGTNGGRVTFVSEDTFTGFRISAYAPSASTTLTVTVDGGTPTGVSLTTVPGEFHELAEISGLADTTHTVEISWPVGANVRFKGLRLLHDGFTGLLTINAGRSSSDATDWRVQNFATHWDLNLTAQDFPLPDITFLNLGTNKNYVATTAATLSTLATELVATGTKVVLGLPGGLGFFTASQDYYDTVYSKLYDIADTLDLPLVDFRAVIGDYAVASAFSSRWLGDDIHENRKGYALEAHALARALAPV